jgi:hypothetical protein
MQPPPNRCVWAPRKGRMNWKTAEAIDVQRIWASHDLRSVLFYLNRIVNVTITKDDLANFKTRRGAASEFQAMPLALATFGLVRTPEYNCLDRDAIPRAHGDIGAPLCHITMRESVESSPVVAIPLPQDGSRWKDGEQ